MGSRYWHNGRFYTSWEIERYLKNLQIDIDQFHTADDLIARLYNMELDHTSKGRLDDIGLDIDNCIEAIRKINEQ